LTRFLRRAAILGAALAVLHGVRLAVGPRAALTTGAVLLVGSLLVLVVLPRVAHRAFRRGAFGRAAVSYWLLGWLRVDGAARAALQLSVAACLLGRERHRDGLARLDRIDRDALRESARAAWHNNRAYALTRSGADAAQAMVDIDAAIALRPDVAAFRHTRGLALLAGGRLDDAIRELDLVWQRGEGGPPLLEAERCFDMGIAWSRKGEREYAADYFERARRAAPGSAWAARAAARLAPSDQLPDALVELA